MNKMDFLTILKESLQNEIPDTLIENNLSFYDNYISNAMNSNHESESKVLDSLGDPRLIAKTIIASHNSSHGNEKSQYTTYNQSDNYDTDNNEDTSKHFHSENKKFNINYDADKGWDIRFGKFKINSWYGKLISIFVIILFIFVIIIISSYIIRLLLPIILLIIFIAFIIRIFK